MVVKVVSPTHRPPLPPRKFSWYSFLLEAESTEGYSLAERIKSMKISGDTIRNRIRYLPACSAVLHPIVPRRKCGRDNMKASFEEIVVWIQLGFQ
jgi:hypothetical protein